eukprot:Awhi_evm1s5826
MPVKTFQRSEVAEHSTADDLWLIYDGKVYDVTNFSESHPGGPDIILMFGGK